MSRKHGSDYPITFPYSVITSSSHTQDYTKGCDSWGSPWGVSIIHYHPLCMYVGSTWAHVEVMGKVDCHLGLCAPLPNQTLRQGFAWNWEMTLGNLQGCGGLRQGREATNKGRVTKLQTVGHSSFNSPWRALEACLLHVSQSYYTRGARE